MFPTVQPGDVPVPGCGPDAGGSLKNPGARKSLALLGAFCLFLSALEYLIPKPLPFMRLGLANLPLLLALDIFPFSAFLALAAVKVLGQALITGTLFSYIFLFSLAGTFFSAAAMYGLRRLLGRGRISFIGAGTAGAVVSTITQLLLAWLFVFRDNVRYLAPPFLAAGVITGFALGLFAEHFAGGSRWYARRRVR
ncbi:MAG: Gx transporter family protein [Treponema sp.]|jgi:heptaprenyl diphosphate synthase|nr:Gx transporter family protein [Treponema sp.]